jgi:hypothetical protein
VTVLLIANRAPETPNASGQQPSGGTSVTTPESTPASTTGPPPPPTRPATTASPGTGECTLGQIILKWTANQPPIERVCVHVSSKITLAMPPLDPDRWQLPTSSDPQIAAVGPLGLDQEGVTYTAVTALRPGSATIRATVRPQDPGDLPRTGTPRQLWLLTITVIA